MTSPAVPSYPAANVVNVWVMRHGEKKGDALTPKGIQQVRASAEMHFEGLHFTHGFHTGKQRVIQTVNEVAEALGENICPSANQDYNPWWAFDPNLPQYDVEQLEADLVGATVYDLLGAWPPAWAMLSQMRQAVKNTAMMIWEMQKQGVAKRDVLICNHTWVAEMAVPNEAVKEAHLMSPADIYRYDVLLQVVDRLRDPEPVIVGYEHLLCPLD